MSFRKLTKFFLSYTSFYSGLTNVYQFFNIKRKSSFTILCYHRVNDFQDSFSPAVSTKNFISQLNYLKKNYKVVPLGKMVKFITEKEKSNIPLASITFDDGYKDVYLHSFPILKKFGFKATIFLSTGFIDSEEIPWTEKIHYLFANTKKNNCFLKFNEELFSFSFKNLYQRVKVCFLIKEILKDVRDFRREELLEDISNQLEIPLKSIKDKNLMLNWEEVREMVKSGFEIGSHTVSHPMLSKCSLEKVKKEIFNSKKVIEEELNYPVESFSYPGDSYNVEVKEIVKSAGYKYACRVGDEVNYLNSDIYLLKRIHIEDGKIPVFANQISLFFNNLSRFIY